MSYMGHICNIWKKMMADSSQLTRRMLRRRKEPEFLKYLFFNHNSSLFLWIKSKFSILIFWQFTYIPSRSMGHIWKFIINFELFATHSYRMLRRRKEPEFLLVDPRFKKGFPWVIRPPRFSSSAWSEKIKRKNRLIKWFL